MTRTIIPKLTKEDIEDLQIACDMASEHLTEFAHKQSSIGESYFSEAMETHARARRFEALKAKLARMK